MNRAILAQNMPAEDSVNSDEYNMHSEDVGATDKILESFKKMEFILTCSI